jgi:hypothetical protein
MSTSSVGLIKDEGSSPGNPDPKQEPDDDPKRSATSTHPDPFIANIDAATGGHGGSTISDAIWGDDDEEKKPKPWKHVSDDVLLRAIAAAQFSPEDSELNTFSGRLDKLLKEANKRGLDLSQVEDITSLGDFMAYAGALGKSTDTNPAKLIEKARAVEDYFRMKEEEEARDEIRDSFDTALEDFKADPRLETLNELIEKLSETPTFSDEFMQRTRNEVSDQIRYAEAAKLRKLNAVFGLRGRGRGSGVQAFLAETAANKASQGLQAIFNQMKMEQESSKRSDLSEEIGMRQDLLYREKEYEASLQQGKAAFHAGSPFVLPGQAAGTFSGYLESLRTRGQATELAREERKTAMKIAYINAAAQIIGSMMEGAGAAAGAAAA